MAEDKLEYFLREFEYKGFPLTKEINDAIKALFKEKEKMRASRERFHIHKRTQVLIN